MNEKENDVYLSLNEKKLSISVFKQSDNSLVFFNEENININSITENTYFEILEKPLEKNIIHTTQYVLYVKMILI